MFVGALRVEAVDRGLPTGELPDGLESDLRRLGGLVVAHQGHAPGVFVEAADMRALDGLVQPAGTAFVDVAVLVDEGAVTDVAPAEVARVVLVDAAHDAGRLALRVVVGTGGVVHRDGADRVGVARRATTDGLVRAPSGAGDDLRHAVGVGAVDDLGDAVVGDLAVDEHRLNVGGAHAGAGLGDVGDVGDGLDVVVARGHGRACADGRSGSLLGRDFFDGGFLSRSFLGRGLLGGSLLRGDLDVFGGRGFRCLGAAGQFEVDAADVDLHAGGGLDVDQLRAGLAVLADDVERVGLVPLAPGSVLALGADEGGDVGLAVPGQREHREGFVGSELFDGAGVVAGALGGDGGVVDDDVVAAGQRDGGFIRGDRVRSVGLGFEDCVAAENGGDGEGDDEECRQRRHQPCWRGVCARIEAASLLHCGDSLKNKY